MKRKTVNIIRFFLEEILPPILRDSIIFKYVVKYFYRKDQTHENLKKNILWINKDEYSEYYKNMPEIQGSTDNSEECIEKIIQNIIPNKVIDVGCGRGYLLNRINSHYKKKENILLYGSEIVKNQKLKKYETEENITIFEKSIEDISEINIKFDTVICTHVLEHILNIEKAYSELKKITKKRLIIVVPKERPYQYSFNGHIHFFPYDWSFINTIKPKKKEFYITEINRDFFYIEDFD